MVPISIRRNDTIDLVGMSLTGNDGSVICTPFLREHFWPDQRRYRPANAGQRHACGDLANCRKCALWRVDEVFVLGELLRHGSIRCYYERSVRLPRNKNASSLPPSKC